MPPTVLLTRPQESSRRFAAEMAALGLPVLVSPIIEIVPLAHDDAAIRAARGLVLTSAHAVPAAGEGQGRPAICVGPATAEAARRAGFDVTEGPGDAARMMPLLRDLGAGWLHLHGRHVARVLPVPGIEVYDQQARPLSAEARELLSGAGPVILPLFSPRSAALLGAAVAGAGAPLWLAAISPAARAAWTGPVAREAVAADPDAPGVRRAVAALLAAEYSDQRRVEAPSGRD